MLQPVKHSRFRLPHFDLPRDRNVLIQHVCGTQDYIKDLPWNLDTSSMPLVLPEMEFIILVGSHSRGVGAEAVHSLIW